MLWVNINPESVGQEPCAPDILNMVIKRLQAGEEEKAIRAISSLKLKDENIPTDFSYITNLLSNDSNYLIVALDKDTPAGFLIAYELQRIDCGQSMMLFYEIEVAPEYQKQGIGKKLIDKLKEYCRERKILKMWVLTSESNIAAQNLYKSTGAVQSKEPEILFEYLPEF